MTAPENRLAFLDSPCVVEGITLHDFYASQAALGILSAYPGIDLLVLAERAHAVASAILALHPNDDECGPDDRYA